MDQVEKLAGRQSFLGQRGQAHRQEILDHLTAKKIMGNESAPMASLAAYLSGWKELVISVGEGRWALADMKDGREKPGPSPAPASLFNQVK
jgi:hypothetical protein